MLLLGNHPMSSAEQLYGLWKTLEEAARAVVQIDRFNGCQLIWRNPQSIHSFDRNSFVGLVSQSQGSLHTIKSSWPFWTKHFLHDRVRPYADSDFQVQQPAQSSAEPMRSSVSSTKQTSTLAKRRDTREDEKDRTQPEDQEMTRTI